MCVWFKVCVCVEGGGGVKVCVRGGGEGGGLMRAFVRYARLSASALQVPVPALRSLTLRLCLRCKHECARGPKTAALI